MTLRKRDTTLGFKPRLALTNEVSRSSLECAQLDGQLRSGNLSPELHQTLLAVARLRNTVSSYRIEGEHIDIERAREVIDSGASATQVELGVLRLAQCYTEVSSGQLPELTIDGLCALHERLYRNVFDDPSIVGHLKTEQNWIDGPFNVPVFYPTPPERTRAELDALFRWLADAGNAYPPPVTAALFFAELEGIHPFLDGNGRIGRLLSLRVLYGLGLRNAPLVPLDTLFFRSVNEYYERLGTTNDGRTYGTWVRFFVESLERAYRLAVTRADLTNVIDKMSRPATRNVLRWVLSTDGDWFVHGSYPNPDEYSPTAVNDALAELTGAGVLVANGQRRGRRYKLSTDFLLSAYNIDQEAAPGPPQA